MPLTRRSKSIIIVAFAITIVLAVGAGILFYLNRKLCENRNEFYHKETSTCYKEGVQGPCQENLVILADRTKRYGICYCPYKYHDRALLYHRQTGHCYFVFSQGFCEDGFWLNVTKEGEPVCELNKCLSKFENSDIVADEIVPMKGGKCAILHHTADGCEENEVVRFHKNYIHPSCKSPPTPKKDKGSSVSVPASTCPSGTNPSHTGHCIPILEIDF